MTSTKDGKSTSVETYRRASRLSDPRTSSRQKLTDLIRIGGVGRTKGRTPRPLGPRRSELRMGTLTFRCRGRLGRYRWSGTGRMEALFARLVPPIERGATLA